ncbi:flagellar protein [bacterium]|nr:flagellar protein [bacterium]
MVDKLLPGQPIQPVSPAQTRTDTARTDVTQPDVDFRQLLDETLRTAGGVKFSAHAVRRLESRGIQLSTTDVAALEAAVDRAAAKGGRDSLMLASNYAMVVNIPSRTVVTAFDQEQLQESVVTNIDSAVFVNELG